MSSLGNTKKGGQRLILKRIWKVLIKKRLSSIPGSLVLRKNEGPSLEGHVQNHCVANTSHPAPASTLKGSLYPISGFLQRQSWISSILLSISQLIVRKFGSSADSRSLCITCVGDALSERKPALCYTCEKCLLSEKGIYPSYRALCGN